MFFFAGTNLQTPLSDEELAEVETIYLYDRSYKTVRSGRRVVKWMMFKKSNPKLQAIANVKSLHALVIDPPSLKHKGIVIFEDPKSCKSTHSIDAPLLLDSSRPTSPIPI